MTRLGVSNRLHFSLPEEVIGINTSFATREENDIITNVYNAHARHTIQGYFCLYSKLSFVSFVLQEGSGLSISVQLLKLVKKE